MLNKNDIKEYLASVGIKRNDTVLIHTSLKSLGGLEGGADMLIDAFCEYLNDGLFIVPTHTWDNVTPEKPFYNVRETLPCIGKLPEIAAFRQDGIRSLHPTHSVAAFGKRAAEYVKGEEKCASPAPKGGCWARLYDERAKILLIGVGLNRNTYFHAVDEILDIKDRLNDKAYTIEITDYDGRKLMSPPFHSHYTAAAPCCCSEFYPNYKKPLERLGALEYSRLGNAEVCLCDAVKSADAIKLLWEKAEYDMCISEREIPEKYYL